MGNELLMFNGTNGQVYLYSDKLVITRNGFFGKTNFIFKGDKTILLKHIGSIQLNKARLLVPGYIQFSVLGGVESRKGLQDAAQDENTVLFSQKHNDKAIELKNMIENKMDSEHNSYVASTNISTADELSKFKKLLDDGIITDLEFEEQKKKLLNS